MTDLTKPISASNPAPSKGIKRDGDGNEILTEKRKGRVKSAKPVDVNNPNAVEDTDEVEDVIEGNLTQPVEASNKTKTGGKVVGTEPASNKGGTDAGVSR